VRSLAHDLGQRLGTGAHLASLKRTLSGDARLQDAVSLDLIEDGERGREAAIAAMIPLSRMLPALPELMLTATGRRAAAHGRDLTPADVLSPATPLNPGNSLSPMHYRLMDSEGNLVGLAAPAHTPGLFHPFLVLM
jgi:tRNA U55 pseudouridine synthase TruB